MCVCIDTHICILHAIGSSQYLVLPILAISVVFQDKSTRKEKALKHNFALRDVITYFHIFFQVSSFLASFRSAISYAKSTAYSCGHAPLKSERSPYSWCTWCDQNAKSKCEKGIVQTLLNQTRCYGEPLNGLLLFITQNHKVKITDLIAYFSVIRQILSQATTEGFEEIITANAVCILFCISISIFFI